ncbi:hypothetical protein ACQEVB_19080 [Pseudonocardia sp. CA-107938]|uniref:hypothetical protein n=1 Tax=Pseudonocardia sp. CA-107938 TaxID=3240021 RepID=UPI003D8B287B
MHTICTLHEVSRHRTPTSRPRRIAAGAGVVGTAPLVLIAAAAVPTAGLLAATGLGLLIGCVAGVGAGFVAADPRRGVRVALTTAAAATPAAVALAGLVMALGPVSVIALPALYAVAGIAWWIGPRAGQRVPTLDA